ncbi:MAG TPA: aromatic ring-hydroxylating dioxygenase subunit alpha [Bryobacteraceae bacterium]|nr:aromatic ring-hydroxylating dioxygenase subunit alpha [Bryobacteraceae bacterium]
MSTVLKTLPACYYTDSDHFRREIDTFFFEDWICAGRADAIPNAGDYFLRDIAGESLIIVRSGAGSVEAFYNVCRHRGTRLCTVAEGNFAGRIQCPYHGWTYGLDGRLLGAPHMDSSLFNHLDYPLHKLHTGLWDGHIFLNAQAHPEPLSVQLADLPTRFAAWRMEELRLRERITYEIHANWKLIVANYNECLHCPVLHPALNRLTDYLGSDNETPHATYIGGSMGFRGAAETMTMDGKRRRDYLPGLNESERKKVCYYSIYPNLLLSLHPDYMMIHTLWPRAVDRTEIICEWYFHPGELSKADFIGDDAIEFWDLTNREDWHIVELSQAGMQSRAYTPGPYSTREELLYAFDRMVVQRSPYSMGGKGLV